MIKEKTPRQSFNCFFDTLQSSAEQFGLGWERQTAELKINLNPDDLLNSLSLEQIYQEWRFNQPTLLEILSHLMDNCGDHAVKSGEALAISIQSEVKEEIPGIKVLYIEVCDNGSGIPDLGEKKIGASSLARHSGSNLAIAAREVDALGGVLLAENIIDDQGEIQGAKFTIILPVPERS